jgi:hypothetical protein
VWGIIGVVYYDSKVEKVTKYNKGYKKQNPGMNRGLFITKADKLRDFLI